MSTKQEIIIEDRLLLSDKKCKDENKETDNVCVSPSSGKYSKVNVFQDELKPIINKKRCFHENCNKRIAKIIGDCKYCNNKFCSEHRLPELHFCKNMIDVKNNSRKNLELKLSNEKCVGDKINNKI